jgi:hypothetical protein
MHQKVWDNIFECNTKTMDDGMSFSFLSPALPTSRNIKGSDLGTNKDWREGLMRQTSKSAITSRRLIPPTDPATEPFSSSRTMESLRDGERRCPTTKRYVCILTNFVMS